MFPRFSLFFSSNQEIFWREYDVRLEFKINPITIFISDEREETAASKTTNNVVNNYWRQ